MTPRGGGTAVIGCGHASLRRVALALLVGIVVAGCATTDPLPTPVPTAEPRPQRGEVQATVDAFLAAWRAGRYADMHGMLAPADQEANRIGPFRSLLEDFDRLAGAHGLSWTSGSVFQAYFAPQPAQHPAATPTPEASGSASPGGAGASPTPEPTPSPTQVPADTPADGPVPAFGVPVRLRFTTDHFGDVDLQRQIFVTAGPDGWQVRWTPQTLFPELATGGKLRLTRQAAPRGSIVGRDGTVWARTRDDGVRVYPQDWLAGQTIGFATGATAKDVRDLGGASGVRKGDLIGRMGLEAGADALLRGSPGFTLSAAGGDGDPVVLLQREMVPGADVIITLRHDLQQTADGQIGGYSEAGTAVVDPKTGDVWALASAPLFNPNAMTLGTTMGGTPLAEPTFAQRLSHATLAAYPAGSSFKVFTLAAALQQGVASPATRMSCNGTWTFSGFTFHNYEDHHLAGLVDLLQAMAFSCNTTYMPLSVQVYDHDQTALTDLIREFGFGQHTGIQYLVDEAGILPDAAYFEKTPRWDGAIRPYGPFDQIQLAIGQGSYLGTPLQLANAYAAIGNGGTLWVPRIVVEARRPDGTVIAKVPREKRRKVSLSKQDLAYVVESMKAVVNYPYGTAYGSFLGFGVQVAGKSGTAETGGPNPDAWFPAIAPAAKPQIAVATVLVRVPLATGGSDAAPLVRQVMARYFANP